MAEGPDDTPIDASPPPEQGRRRWRIGRSVFYGFLVAWLVVALWNLYKPLPNGTSVRGEVVETPLNRLQFFADVSGADVFGAPVVNQQIFDAILRTIGDAHQYIVVDFFLFNGQRGATTTAPRRELSVELREALLKRKREMPGMQVLVLIDPINEV